jgi:hypothetical protein
VSRFSLDWRHQLSSNERFKEANSSSNTWRRFGEFTKQWKSQNDKYKRRKMSKMSRNCDFCYFNVYERNKTENQKYNNFVGYQNNNKSTSAMEISQ